MLAGERAGFMRVSDDMYGTPDGHITLTSNNNIYLIFCPPAAAAAAAALTSYSLFTLRRARSQWRARMNRLYWLLPVTGV